MSRIRAVLFGSGDFALPALKALSKPPFELLAVVTQPDRPSGRGKQPSPTPVKAAAKEIPTFEPNRPEDILGELSKLKPDVIVVVDYGQIIPESIIDLGPIVNVHPSLLPKYRGTTPLQTALLRGDSETGLSLIEIDEKLDHGAIISQDKVAISDDDFTSLNTKVVQLVEPILRENLPKYLAGELSPVSQDDSAATFTKKLTKKDGEIDWEQPADQILRQIRALNPWPGTYTTWNGKQVKIVDAEQLEEASEPGRVSRNELAVGAGLGSVKVKRLQLEGRNLLTDKDFLSGNAGILGAKLG